MARRCKYGKLKSPTGGRVCKKKPKRGKKGVSCKYGKLKNPTKTRRCKKKPGGRR